LTFIYRTYTIQAVTSLTTKDSQPIDHKQTRECDTQDAVEWHGWARTLRRLGLAKLTAAFLESGSPFSTLAAQALYMSQPLLEPWTAKGRVRDLAELLESPADVTAFTRLLKEETQ
jgi:hypothetical protein